MKTNYRSAKRLMSLALALALVLGMAPVYAVASGNAASVTVGGTTAEYATVQEAVNAAAGGGTVTLLRDAQLDAQVELTGGTVKLDLAGYELVNNGTGNVLYVNGANLTVMDSSAAKTGALTPNGSSIYNSGIWLENGTAVVDGVITNGGYRAVTVAGGTMTIDDITTDEDICVEGGELIINGGSMEQLDMSGGETVVNGGYFSTTSGITYLLYLNGGNVTVNGGTFAFCDNYGIRFNDGDSFAYIRGGIYTNGLKMSCSYSSYLDIYLWDILEPGYHLYDDSGNPIEIDYYTEKVNGYVAVSQTSPGPRMYSITYTLTGLTCSYTSPTIQKGYSLFANLTAQEGYAVPDTITVKMDGKTVSSSSYSYSNGFLRLMSNAITGDIEIIAKAVEAWIYTVEGSITGTDGNDMTLSGGVYTKTYHSVPVGTDYTLSVRGTAACGTTQSATVTFDVTAVCDVTVTYDPVTGEVTVTGDGVDFNIPTVRYIYFDNSSKGWSTVNIYAWYDGSTQIAGAWPGTRMTPVEGDSDVYMYALPVDAVNVIFNNGSQQTGDLTAPAYTTGLNMYDPATDSWVAYVNENEPDPEEPAPEPEKPADRVVYFENTAGWSKPYIYSWTTANGVTTHYVGGWPGTAMTPVEGQEDLYSYVLPGDAQNVIFHNNSGTQTGDLVLPAADSGLNRYHFATGQWSAYTVEEPEDSKDIKWQVTSGTNADSASTNLRFLTWVDSLENYSAVTFNVTINGKTTKLACTTVYTAILASGVAIRNPDQVFDNENAKYFATYTLKNIPSSAFDTPIVVTVTWTDLQGSETTSESKTIVISSDWNK